MKDIITKIKEWVSTKTWAKIGLPIIAVLVALGVYYGVIDNTASAAALHLLN